jgi:hypothetical protein
MRIFIFILFLGILAGCSTTSSPLDNYKLEGFYGTTGEAGFRLKNKCGDEKTVVFSCMTKVFSDGEGHIYEDEVIKSFLKKQFLEMTKITEKDFDSTPLPVSLKRYKGKIKDRPYFILSFMENIEYNNSRISKEKKELNRIYQAKNEKFLHENIEKLDLLIKVKKNGRYITHKKSITDKKMMREYKLLTSLETKPYLLDMKNYRDVKNYSSLVFYTAKGKVVVYIADKVFLWEGENKEKYAFKAFALTKQLLRDVNGIEGNEEVVKNLKGQLKSIDRKAYFIELASYRVLSDQK